MEKLRKTNIFSATFHIWHTGHFATINGFRYIPSMALKRLKPQTNASNQWRHEKSPNEQGLGVKNPIVEKSLSHTNFIPNLTKPSRFVQTPELCSLFPTPAVGSLDHSKPYSYV